jgi:hypothetical protein
VTVSFLNQLKSQATELKSQQAVVAQDLTANTANTEAACQTVARYLRDLAKHLSVIEPSGPHFTLDGKTPWPAMKLSDFHSDSRKKILRDKEVFDTMAMGWTITPKMGVAVGGAVTVTFIPEVERIQQILTFAHVEHERKETRHPQRNSLQSVRFEYTTEARGNVSIKADHDAARLVFRVANANGFGISTSAIPAEKITSDLMDELAKLIVAQTSTFA